MTEPDPGTSARLADATFKSLQTEHDKRVAHGEAFRHHRHYFKPVTRWHSPDGMPPYYQTIERYEPCECGARWPGTDFAALKPNVEAVARLYRERYGVSPWVGTRYLGDGWPPTEIVDWDAQRERVAARLDAMGSLADEIEFDWPAGGRTNLEVVMGARDQRTARVVLTRRGYRRLGVTGDLPPVYAMLVALADRAYEDAAIRTRQLWLYGGIVEELTYE
jgi:hypothetical protein